MTVALTSKFLANARGLTFKDSAGVTWSLNANTNELSAATAGGAGLTSVGLSDSSGTPIYTVGNSPLVANGTLTLTLNNQVQKTFFAGPASGANAQPGFRVIAAADVPALAYVTSVGLSDGSTSPIYSISGSPVTASGTLAFTLATQVQKTFFAGPTSGANAQPAFRVLAVADVPTLNQNTSGTAAGLSVTLLATSGGTGQSVYAVGDLLYADTTTTLAKRADVAAGSYLRSGGVSVAPVWSTVTLPNTATQGDIWYSSASNVMTALADVAAGSYLRSGGVGANPVWSTVTVPNAAVLGDLWYGSAASAVSALAGTISATKQFLTQTGNGSISAAPAWGTIAAGDLPANGANPTASLGLAAINGVATTWMRSDGAPALSQSIIPTWTGAHTFSALLTANLGITVAGATLKVAVGTATLAPITMQSGTSLTSPLAGVMEYDGTTFYSSPAASSRGVCLTEYVEVMSGTKTLTSQTAAQAILNGTTNGAVTLPVGTYEFDCFFSLTALSATSGAFGFALGGTATFTQAWWAIADKPAALATAAAPQMTFDTAANTLIASAATGTVGYAQITGIIRVTVAGTVIPQVSQTTAAAAVVGANSFARFRVVGNATVQSVGNWS